MFVLLSCRLKINFLILSYLCVGSHAAESCYKYSIVGILVSSPAVVGRKSS